MNEKDTRIAEMREARQVLTHVGIILAAGLFLVFVILGAAGFWDPIVTLR